MHEEEIHSCRDRLAEGRQSGVDRGAEASDAAAVGHLQAVAGAGKIREGGAARAPVAVGDDLCKRGHAPL